MKNIGIKNYIEDDTPGFKSVSFRDHINGKTAIKLKPWGIYRGLFFERIQQLNTEKYAGWSADKKRRNANIYAVQNTPKMWRKQYEVERYRGA